MSTTSLNPECGTVTLATDAKAAEAVLDAVREANGRRALRPVETVEAAEAEVRDFLVVPEWSTGERAANVAADVLRQLHGVEPARAPYLWGLYTEGARRLGFTGDVPVPVLSGTARGAEA